MEPWQGYEIHGQVQSEGRQTAGGIAFLVFVGDERDSRGDERSGDHSGDIGALAQPVGRDGRGGVEAVGRGRDGRVHRHARRPHGLVPGQAHQDGVWHEHHGPTPKARSYGMIGGDGINDESNKTAPPPTGLF